MSLILTPVTPGSLSASTQTPSSATLTSYPYLVKQIPVTPDGGVADLYSTVQAFVTAQSAGTICSLAAGSYRLSADIVMPNGVSLSGAGAERTQILFDDVTGNGFTWAGPSWNVSNTLSANVAAGATTVTVTSNGNQYTPGMWVYVTDTDSSSIGAPFVTRVVSVSTNTITLQDALPQAYTTAHTATLYGSTVGLWSGMSVQGVGFGITSKAYTGNATARNSFLKINGCKNFLIDDCLFDGAYSEGVWVESQSHGVKIRDSRFTGCQGDGSGAYGIVISDSTRCSVQGVEVEHCSAGIAFQHSPYPMIEGNQVRNCTNRGIKILWGCNFAVVNNNQVSDVTLTGIHNDNSMGCTISGNTLHNVASDTDSAAINLSQTATALTYPGNVVSGNSIRQYSRVGITVAVRHQYARIVGNDLGYSQAPISTVGGIYCNASDVTIASNGIHDCGAASTATGIQIIPDSAQGADRGLISGNHIRGTGTAIDTSTAGGFTSAARGCVVNGNLTNGGTISTAANDSVTDNT